MSVKVLHVFGIMNRGGAELRTISGIEGMKRRGVEFDFLVLSGSKGVLDSSLIEQGCKIHYCKLGAKFPFQFIRILRQGQYDIVHSHVSLVSGIILALAKIVGINTTIAHFRSTHDVQHKSTFRKLRDFVLRRLLLLSASKILAVCQGAMDAFWPPSWRDNTKFSVIYNGFDIALPEFQKNFWAKYISGYSGQDVIVNVARMHEQKNHKGLAHIFSNFAQKNDDAQLVLIGKEDPHIKSMMIDIFKRYKCFDRVTFLGEKADVYPFVYHSSLMLFPSAWEGLPGAVIESACLGTPVVGSEIPGIVEISRQLNTVVTVPLDAPLEFWSSRIEELIQQPVDKEKSRNEFMSSDFRLEANIDQLYGAYRS
ncbi:glycosyltransferase [Neiella sp. HB171785]|uniref:Glycosyltransferase n=1 Tax=Neiella litorisoli TaxID=2771431 RepID=A0A8J6UQ80_9GAMM|nr:glycosyltransferase [Neiella litorisoli]MBD1390512.1 glycosyltransferase [Neiella litorisoli]